MLLSTTTENRDNCSKEEKEEEEEDTVVFSSRPRSRHPRFVEHYIPLPKSEFLVFSEHVNTNIAYIISIDLHRRYFKEPWFEKITRYDVDDGRFIGIERLDVYVVVGVYVALQYRAYFGTGHRLPSIVYRR